MPCFPVCREAFPDVLRLLAPVAAGGSVNAEPTGYYDPLPERTGPYEEDHRQEGRHHYDCEYACALVQACHSTRQLKDLNNNSAAEGNLIEPRVPTAAPMLQSLQAFTNICTTCWLIGQICLDPQS
jgi:hypothetical protein